MKKSKFFCIIYLFLLCLPLLTMNRENDYVSEIDNTYLPNFSLSKSFFINDLEDYVEKRIGGREEAIWAYEKINDLFFEILVHPNYMYGKEKHVFCKGEAFLDDFQHLNSNVEYAETFAEYIASLQKIAEENDIYFQYVLCIDKKTIYPEYYPNGVNVSENISRTQEILTELEEKNVNYLYAKKCMEDAKNSGIEVYNRKYDAGHWNDHGAFLLSQEIFKILVKKFENLEMLSIEDYMVGTCVEKYIQTSKFKIDETVPNYVAKRNDAVVTTQFDENMPGKKVFFSHYENNSIKGPKILVFRDSYLDRASKFFINYFSEATFASYSNLTSIDDYEEYIKILQPDIIIFENVERTFPLEVHE